MGREPKKIIAGGPMMGFAVMDTDFPTTKTTGALLCLSEDEVSKYETTACINCGRCVEACPENLIPSRLAKFSEHDDKEQFESAFTNKTKCVFVESLGNPSIRIADIEYLAKVSHKNGVPLIVDNTVPSSYLCQPIK